MVPTRVRHWIACYGAAAAIILDQLASIPRATIIETPTPQVRIRDRYVGKSGWHPDELITRASGQAWVLVWDRPGGTTPGASGNRFLSN